MRKEASLIGMLGILLLAVGCSSSGSGMTWIQNPEPFPEAPIPRDVQFSDIPIPWGFQARRAESYVYQSGSLRVGALRYTGSLDPRRVIEFLQEQMPVNGWKFVRTTGFGGRTLSYQKRERDKTEEVVIQILEEERDVVLLIELHPLGGE